MMSGHDKPTTNQQGLPVRGFNPFEKYESTWSISPSRGKNEKCVKPSVSKVQMFITKSQKSNRNKPCQPTRSLSSRIRTRLQQACFFHFLLNCKRLPTKSFLGGLAFSFRGIFVGRETSYWRRHGFGPCRARKFQRHLRVNEKQKTEGSYN